MTQRVLILEDQAFQRGFLANLFGSRADVQVDACEDVEAGRRAVCAARSYDLVLSDLLMPGQDGIQFIQALAAQSASAAPGGGQRGPAADDDLGTADGRIAGAGCDRPVAQAGGGGTTWRPCSRRWRGRVRPPAARARTGCAGTRRTQTAPGHGRRQPHRLVPAEEIAAVRTGGGRRSAGALAPSAAGDAGRGQLPAGDLPPRVGGRAAADGAQGQHRGAGALAQDRASGCRSRSTCRRTCWSRPTCPMNCWR